MNLFQRAFANHNLTPGERAVLKTLQSLIIGAIITALFAAASFLSKPGSVDIHDLIYVVVIALIFSLAHGIAKFVTASGDAPLGAAIEAVTDAAEQKIPPIPPAPPGTSNPPA